MIVNKTVFTTAPVSNGRIEKEIETFRILDELSIKYERIEHEPAMTIEDCQEIDNIFGTPMCKNLFLRNSNGSQYYLLLIMGEKSFKTKDVSAKIGSTRLSFGNEEDMLKLLNLTPGSVTIMGLNYDTEQKVKLLIDSDLLKSEYLVFHPCINTSSVKALTTEMFGKYLEYVKHVPTFIDI